MWLSENSQEPFRSAIYQTFKRPLPSRSIAEVASIEAAERDPWMSSAGL
jgi:hypothetical protein